MAVRNPRYVLDADVFITANNGYYAPDICPSFWGCLLQAHRAGYVISIDRVRDELLDGNDNLVDWVRDEASLMFVPSTESAIVTTFSRMSTWVQQNQQFTDAAKAEFADAADGWLAAYASVHSITLVTLETFEPNIKRKVKLPNVCRQFGVEDINTFEMLRRLGISF